MMIYLITVAILIIGGLSIRFISHDKRKQKLYLTLLSFIILFSLFALKKITLGADMASYLSFYSEISENGISYIFKNFHSDYVFYLFMWLFTIVKVPFLAYMIAYYFITFSCLAYFAYKTTENPDIFFLLFISFPCFGFAFSVLREFMAISIVALAFTFLKSPTKIHLFIYYVLCLLAIGNHSGAVIALFIPLFFLIPFDRFYFYWIVCFLAVYFLCYKSIIPLLIKFSGNIYKAEEYPPSYKNYLFYFALFVTVFFYYSKTPTLNNLEKIKLFNRNNPKANYPKKPFSFALIFFIVFLLFTTTAVSSNLFRLYYYFLIIGLSSLSNFDNLTVFSDPKINLAGKVLIAIFALVSFGLMFIQKNDAYKILNYDFFWR